MTKEEKFLRLKLHEELRLNEDTFVMKVLGGYIYKFYDQKLSTRTDSYDWYLVSTQFVPDDRKTTW